MGIFETVTPNKSTKRQMKVQCSFLSSWERRWEKHSNWDEARAFTVQDKAAAWKIKSIEHTDFMRQNNALLIKENNNAHTKLYSLRFNLEINGQSYIFPL